MQVSLLVPLLSTTSLFCAMLDVVPVNVRLLAGPGDAEGVGAPGTTGGGGGGMSMPSISSISSELTSLRSDLPPSYSSLSLSLSLSLFVSASISISLLLRVLRLDVDSATEMDELLVIRRPELWL